MISLPKHISNILNKVAVKIMPDLSEKLLATADRNKSWDYSSPSIIKIFNMTKK